MNFDALEECNSMDFKDYLSRDWTTQPSYVWIRRALDKDEECFRVVSLSGPNNIILENVEGLWKSPSGRWMKKPAHSNRV